MVMAGHSFFTYEDLYASKSQDYFLTPISEVLSSFTTSESIPVLDIPTTTIIPTRYLAELASSKEIKSKSGLNKLADVIPFAYFYWVLLILAILLTFTLIIIFICYCHAFFKNYTTRRQSLPTFNRYRTVNRRVYAHDIYQPTAPPPLALPTPPCPSKSLESLNNQFHRLSLDLTVSPHIACLDRYRKEPLSTFTSSSSNLPSALQSHLSARSSDPPLKINQSYELQRASMALEDDLKKDSSVIDNN